MGIILSLIYRIVLTRRNNIDRYLNIERRVLREICAPRPGAVRIVILISLVDILSEIKTGCGGVSNTGPMTRGGEGSSPTPDRARSSATVVAYQLFEHLLGDTCLFHCAVHLLRVHNIVWQSCWQQYKLVSTQVPSKIIHYKKKIHIVYGRFTLILFTVFE